MRVAHECKIYLYDDLQWPKWSYHEYYRPFARCECQSIRGKTNSEESYVTAAETRKTAIVPEVTIAAIKKFFPAETRKTT